MAESTLSLSYADLQEEVAFYLGYGRTAANWTADQLAAVVSCVRSGLRQFYFPPPLPGFNNAHEWSFLRPTLTLAVSIAADDVQLPDDFGGLEGELYYAGSDSTLPCAVPVEGEGRILQKRAEYPSTTGRPIMAAIRPHRQLSPTHGQRFELMLWPTTDRAYSFNLSYYLLPQALTDERPYPYGGAAHAETILASCLKVAERRLDDTMSVHAADFSEKLAASVAQDRKFKPQLLGVNADRSDWREGRSRLRYPHGYAAVRVNNVAY